MEGHPGEHQKKMLVLGYYKKLNKYSWMKESVCVCWWKFRKFDDERNSLERETGAGRVGNGTSSIDLKVLILFRRK